MEPQQHMKADSLRTKIAALTLVLKKLQNARRKMEDKKIKATTSDSSQPFDFRLSSSWVSDTLALDEITTTEWKMLTDEQQRNLKLFCINRLILMYQYELKKSQEAYDKL